MLTGWKGRRCEYPGEVLNQGDGIVVRLDRKTYNPVLRQADLPVTQVPWWGDRTLRFEYR